MSIYVTYPWAGGGRRADIGVVLLGSGTGKAPFWVVNVGGDPPYGKDPGEVPPSCV